MSKHSVSSTGSFQGAWRYGIKIFIGYLIVNILLHLITYPWVSFYNNSGYLIMMVISMMVGSYFPYRKLFRSSKVMVSLKEMLPIWWRSSLLIFLATALSYPAFLALGALSLAVKQYLIIAIMLLVLVVVVFALNWLLTFLSYLILKEK